ncbi:hypothetical protein TeGR_g7227 [Tetraparma gracilis]|uniref:Uncharacterized protein n=1 Tax=Tetraparma gracilis TaxID=2962635 RepID=A0ABQ6MRK7_9STRA|nr:hypothetical protein TeGR_g7227 [Tetraparma gracilis]
MCWNVEFSLLSCFVGWAACGLLVYKGTARSKWYASYLVTYTFTQLVDIALWLIHEDHPLSSCPDYSESFKSPSEASPDILSNLIISKYVIPLVVLSQYWQQLSYPSEYFKNSRLYLKMVFIPAVIGMHFQFGCSDIITAQFPEPHDTIRWGAASNTADKVLPVVFVTTFFFWLLMPTRVAIAHTATFWSVVGTLWFTEGTLALGSKWCTYCLIFSFVYLTDPIWNPEPKGKKGKGKKQK